MLVFFVVVFKWDTSVWIDEELRVVELGLQINIFDMNLKGWEVAEWTFNSAVLKLIVDHLLEIAAFALLQ